MLSSLDWYLSFLSKYDERFFLAEDIKIKSEVEFYIITIPPQMYLIVKYNNEAFWIDPFSIGYFVESISSPSQAKNMLLDCMSVSGKSINQDAYNQIIHEIVKSGKKDWIINENPQAYGATCSTIPEHKELFIVKLLMLNNSEITEKHFIVDSGGHVTNIVNNICIKGPLSIAGAVPMDKDLPLFNSIISSAMEKEKHDLKGGKTTAPNAEDNDILILK